MNDFFSWLTHEFSDPLTATAQIVGFVPLALSVFLFVSDDRRKIIAVKTLSDILWAVHFFLLGDVVGGAINTVNTVRNIVFSQKTKKWASGKFIPILFCLLTVVAAWIRWDAWYSALPMVGSLAAVIGFWCNDVRLVRALNLPANILWLIYGALVGSISTILCNAFAVCSILWAEIRNCLKRRKGNNGDRACE